MRPQRRFNIEIGQDSENNAQTLDDDPCLREEVRTEARLDEVWHTREITGHGPLMGSISK